MTHDALVTLLPDSLTHDGNIGEASWQRRKSLETRNVVLEAALDCLSDGGYAGCSLQLVADRAGLSRGAMLHHYAAKLDLMAAVIEYALYKRMERFLDRIRRLSDEERTARFHGITVAYESCHEREYRAYLALHLASRTDADLRPIFVERARRYDRVWRAEIEKVFPEWRDATQLDAMNDFVWVVVEGVALNSDIWEDPARARTVIDLVVNVVQQFHAGGLATER
ncbi:TetR/AcrR family transcriptional regulator [Sphingomonas profundi]|uniref:TetR/AcrR family transcriptional regulator n=1 Tax=Alterirhizorhabdus profundi TaxID=2681549 RepID=UPI0018D0DA8F|nr:TetR/AcrR family transcriptional regulator [Sphingomonas profundi]